MSITTENVFAWIQDNAHPVVSLDQVKSQFPSEGRVLPMVLGELFRRGPGQDRIMRRNSSTGHVFYWTDLTNDEATCVDLKAHKPTKNKVKPKAAVKSNTYTSTIVSEHKACTVGLKELFLNLTNIYTSILKPLSVAQRLESLGQIEYHFQAYLKNVNADIVSVICDSTNNGIVVQSLEDVLVTSVIQFSHAAVSYSICSTEEVYELWNTGEENYYCTLVDLYTSKNEVAATEDTLDKKDILVTSVVEEAETEQEQEQENVQASTRTVSAVNQAPRPGTLRRNCVTAAVALAVYKSPLPLTAKQLEAVCPELNPIDIKRVLTQLSTETNSTKYPQYFKRKATESSREPCYAWSGVFSYPFSTRLPIDDCDPLSLETLDFKTVEAPSVKEAAEQKFEAEVLQIFVDNELNLDPLPTNIEIEKKADLELEAPINLKDILPNSYSSTAISVAQKPSLDFVAGLYTTGELSLRLGQTFLEISSENTQKLIRLLGPHYKTNMDQQTTI